MEEVRVDDILTQIRDLLDRKNFVSLRHELAEIYPMDLAEIFEELPPDECLVLFRLLHKDQAAEVFSYMEGAARKELASSIRESLLQHILDELYFDDKIDFLEEMPANFVKNLIQNSPQEERARINQFLNYPDNSAGSLMTIEYVDLKKHMTVGQALARIKEIGPDTETIYTCYVLDDTRHLEGIVSLRRLVLSGEDELVSDLMNDDVVLCMAHDDQEEVAEQFKKYDLMAIPVVDGESRLIGIITIDDIVDVIEQENTEDFQKMAAMTPSDEEYLDTGVFKLAKNRIVWLLVLMISATFTGGIITHFEGLLSTAVMLTAFIPMLMDSGGNAGSQSSTMIIRGIALGEISLRDWPKILWKEFRVGLVAGCTLGIVNVGRMFLIGNRDYMVMLTVSLTLMVTVVIAKLVGGILPIVAKALRLDPAIMAGPLITTIVDALSLFVYFTAASLLIL
ncbi:magnesium transporter [Ruminococcaceae bacterium OttesenSCG-928-L11]|nr:magnesium transporter [Ruminococcaceae bacterium OttesenSCG-928-L11]